MTIAILLMFVVILVGGWVRFRDEIKAWMATASEQMSPSKVLEQQREERLAAEAREAEALAESRRIGGLDPDDPDAKLSASQRAKARQPRSPKPSAPATPAPDGVQGGSSAKPIGRKRDQKP